jgi:hypothetical protein
MAAWDKYGIWGGVVYADTLRGMPYWGCLLHPYSSSPAVIDEINCSDDRGCPAKHAPPAQLRSVARPAHLEPQQAVRPKTRPADAISIWNCVGEVEAERRGEEVVTRHHAAVRMIRSQPWRTGRWGERRELLG